jgi:hypothetical protein
MEQPGKERYTTNAWLIGSLGRLWQTLTAHIHERGVHPRSAAEQDLEVIFTTVA